jgi:hypothetical protein
MPDKEEPFEGEIINIIQQTGLDDGPPRKRAKRISRAKTTPEALPPPQAPENGLEKSSVREPSSGSPPATAVQASGGSVAQAHAEAGRPPEEIPAAPPLNALALVDKYIANRDVDVEKFARLVELVREERDYHARLAFNAAKGRVCAGLVNVRIIKNKSVLYHEEKNNPRSPLIEAFKYAPLEDIHKIVAPLLIENEMDLSYTDEPQADGRVLIRGRLKYLPSDYYEDSFMAAPLDTSGGKNNIQAVGSTNSYLRRYVCANIFNIVVVGDDDDGTGGFVDDAQLANLRELIGQVQAKSPRSNEAAFCSLMKITTLGELTCRRYPAAVSVLNERIQKAG